MVQVQPWAIHRLQRRSLPGQLPEQLLVRVAGFQRLDTQKRRRFLEGDSQSRSGQGKGCGRRKGRRKRGESNVVKCGSQKIAVCLNFSMP